MALDPTMELSSEVMAMPLPDPRLKLRVQQMVNQMQKAPDASIPQQMVGDKADIKGAYRFLANERVLHQALLAGVREATLQRIEDRVQAGDEVVLLIQDTVSFNFTHHPATTGLGTLEKPHLRGFFAHNTLAVSQAGVPLGLIEQQVWVRPEAELGKSHERKQRAFEEKESFKWVKGSPSAVTVAPSVLHDKSVLDIVIGDRESHIYAFLADCYANQQAVIVRACQGRAFTAEGHDLFDEIQSWPVQHAYDFEVPRIPNREARETRLALRYGTISLKRPKRTKTPYETLTLQVVYVMEIDPPPGIEHIYWVLLTSLPVNSVAQALQIVKWYTYRWLVERFHYVLKSGCRLEERQIQTVGGLQRLLGVFNMVAWRLLWLTYQSCQTPDVSCLVALEWDEWQALYATIHQTQEIPGTPPTLSEAVRWIARLGGFLGRTSDGEPGVKVLWRGWRKLQTLTAMWRLLRSPPKDVGNV